MNISELYKFIYKYLLEKYRNLSLEFLLYIRTIYG